MVTQDNLHVLQEAPSTLLCTGPGPQTRGLWFKTQEIFTSHKAIPVMWDNRRESLKGQQQHRFAYQGFWEEHRYTRNVRYQGGGRRLGRHQLERTVPHTWYDEGSRWQVGALHSALGGDHVDTDLPSSIPLRASHNLHLCSAVHHLAWA